MRYISYREMHSPYTNSSAGFESDEPLPAVSIKRVVDDNRYISFRGTNFSVGQLAEIIERSPNFNVSQTSIGKIFNEFEYPNPVEKEIICKSNLGYRDSIGLCAEILYKSGNIARAETFARHGSERRNVRSLKVLAWILEDQTQYFQAASIYLELTGGKHEDMHLAGFWYGRTLLKMGKVDKAKTWLKKSVKVGIEDAAELLESVTN